MAKAKPLFRKRPIEVSAHRVSQGGFINTLEGTMRAEVGDWIIEGIEGEHYPCKDSIFRKTYEPSNNAGRQEWEA
jgi:hypothetical protein